MLIKLRENKGSMAVYTSIVLLSMLLILTAVFLTSSAMRKSQLTTTIKVKESYEADNDRAGDIYDALTGNVKPEYVSDGLILRYDANNNTGNGHSTTATTWKDLSGNNRDCNLQNFDNNANSGWTSNSLKLDGINDYGVIQNLDMSGYNEITICATYKVLSVPNRADCRPAILCSNSAGPGRIYLGYNGSNAYALNYSEPDTWFTTNNGDMVLNQTTSVGATYMARNSAEKNRIYKNGTLLKEMQATMTTNWSNYTLTLGQGFGGDYASGDNAAHPYPNVEIYDILIYNRILSQAEMEQNYKAAQQNFGF